MIDDDVRGLGRGCDWEGGWGEDVIGIHYISMRPQRNGMVTLRTSMKQKLMVNIRKQQLWVCFSNLRILYAYLMLP